MFILWGRNSLITKKKSRITKLASPRKKREKIHTSSQINSKKVDIFLTIALTQTSKQTKTITSFSAHMLVYEWPSLTTWLTGKIHDLQTAPWFFIHARLVNMSHSAICDSCPSRTSHWSEQVDLTPDVPQQRKGTREKRPREPTYRTFATIVTTVEG